MPISVDSKDNNLYNGIDNNLIINYINDESKQFNIILTTNNGRMIKSENGWLTIPRNAGRSFVTIYLISLNNDTLLIGKKEFTVKKVPYPVLKISNTVISDSMWLNRKIFFTKDSLKLFFTDDLPESNYWYQVKFFTIGYSFGGRYISIDNNGPSFSNKSLEFIRKLSQGHQLVIKVTSVTPSGILKFLPLIRFRIY